MTPEARREQNRNAKQAQRQREKEQGLIKHEIKLTTAENKTLALSRELYQGDYASFMRRALLTGAKFIANSGNARGGKKRIRTLRADDTNG